MKWTNWITTTQLLGELNQRAKNHGIEFALRSASNLTRRIKENQTMFKTQGIRFQTKHGERGTEWTFNTPEKKKNENETSEVFTSGRSSTNRGIRKLTQLKELTELTGYCYRKSFKQSL